MAVVKLDATCVNRPLASSAALAMPEEANNVPMNLVCTEAIGFFWCDILFTCSVPRGKRTFLPRRSTRPACREGIVVSTKLIELFTGHPLGVKWLLTHSIEVAVRVFAHLRL